MKAWISKLYIHSTRCNLIIWPCLSVCGAGIQRLSKLKFSYDGKVQLVLRSYWYIDSANSLSFVRMWCWPDGLKIACYLKKCGTDFRLYCSVTDRHTCRCRELYVGLWHRGAHAFPPAIVIWRGDATGCIAVLLV